MYNSTMRNMIMIVQLLALQLCATSFVFGQGQTEEMWSKLNIATGEKFAAANSDAPSLVPSDAPSFVPSDSPSLAPSDVPSLAPSAYSSELPTLALSEPTDRDAAGIQSGESSATKAALSATAALGLITLLM
ncbi:hypothetical protein MPSEU_000648300 [Mayamaea pseudoterrestris]|nr:hypothetical protein MPSEU_000648300 [Mayamaea pseudoterrestris]